MGRTDEGLLARRSALEAQAVQQREQLSARRMDLAEPRTLHLAFSAGTEEAARSLAAALVRNEMPTPVIVVPEPESDRRRWGVHTSIVGSVDFITTRRNLVTFILLADNYDGDFDGWEALGTEPIDRIGDK